MREHAEGDVGIGDERHVRREQRVAAEQGHEPRRAGGEDQVVGVFGVDEAQRPEVLGGLQQVPRKAALSVSITGMAARHALMSVGTGCASSGCPHR